MIVHSQGKTSTIQQQDLDRLPSDDWAQFIRQWYSNLHIEITTSGSTGKPKNIKLTKELIEWSANNTKKVLELQDESVFLCIPVSKVGGLMLLLRSLIFDWDVLIEKASANPMLNLESNHRYTLVSLVPYQLLHIMEDEASWQKLMRFTTVLVGGASIDKIVENQIIIKSGGSKTRFFHSYGMTETASHIAIRRFGEDWYRVFDDVEVSLQDNKCLNIKIPRLHINLNTNDLVEIKEHCLQFLGRSDDAVNSGGVKLLLHTITDRIDATLARELLDVDYVLWKQPHPKLGEQLIFIGVKNRLYLLIEEAIKNDIPSIECPKKFYWVDAFERTESGKIDRIATLDKLLEVGG
ncbi:MAG: AMP-binding protein [Bacteroidia bacterium]|nr:AMP-binding protein [Bacteroidia bacterium]